MRRHSTIEVHPAVSDAPHLRSSIPHPKPNFSKTQIASRRTIPWSDSRKRFFFEIKIDIPTIWAQGTPSFRNKIAEMCYLYRRRGLRCTCTSREAPTVVLVVLVVVVVVVVVSLHNGTPTVGVPRFDPISSDRMNSSSKWLLVHRFFGVGLQWLIA